MIPGWNRSPSQRIDQWARCDSSITVALTPDINHGVGRRCSFRRSCCAVPLQTGAIRLEFRGPVLYRQHRVGLNGQSFTLFKFRSVRIDEEAGRPCWATIHDPRITRIGHFIRVSRIDGLPQLFNVGASGFCLSGNGRIPFAPPRPNRFRVALVSTLQGLLQRQAQLSEQFSHGKIIPAHNHASVRFVGLDRYQELSC
jgi:hypothetical protein